MVIDTSALVAILCNEAERPAFVEALSSVEHAMVSAATHAETSIVIDRRFGAEGVRDLDLLLAAASVEIVPVDANHALVARQAYRTYGKGRHPAGLNFGACFSYALAKIEQRPLLFKGDDFAHTDLQAYR